MFLFSGSACQHFSLPQQVQNPPLGQSKPAKGTHSEASFWINNPFRGFAFRQSSVENQWRQNVARRVSQ
jgi:hypothetical protein